MAGGFSAGRLIGRLAAVLALAAMTACAVPMDNGSQGTPGADPALVARADIMTRTILEAALVGGLAGALGTEVVLQLIARFEGEIAALDANLNTPVTTAAPDPAAQQDGLLHSFKGAALTLGLLRSGHMAQDLRTRLPIAPPEIEALVTQARADAAEARRSLSANMEAAAG